MANVVYPKAKEGFLGATIDWDTDVIRAVLIDTAIYTYNSADQFYSAVSSAVVGTESPPFTAKTITNGVADAAVTTFTAVTGATVEAIVIFTDTGNPATDELIAFIDTDAGGAISVTPNGGDITVTWNASGIFAL